jgi:hypothetical protein
MKFTQIKKYVPPKPDAVAYRYNGQVIMHIPSEHIDKVGLSESVKVFQSGSGKTLMFKHDDDGTGFALRPGDAGRMVVAFRAEGPVSDILPEGRTDFFSESYKEEAVLVRAR